MENTVTHTISKRQKTAGVLLFIGILTGILSSWINNSYLNLMSFMSNPPSDFLPYESYLLDELLDESHLLGFAIFAQLITAIGPAFQAIGLALLLSKRLNRPTYCMTILLLAANLFIIIASLIILVICNFSTLSSYNTYYNIIYSALSFVIIYAISIIIRNNTLTQKERIYSVMIILFYLSSCSCRLMHSSFSITIILMIILCFFAAPSWNKLARSTVFIGGNGHTTEATYNPFNKYLIGSVFGLIFISAPLIIQTIL